jgi:hypothetical protein
MEKQHFTPSNLLAGATATVNWLTDTGFALR